MARIWVLFALCFILRTATSADEVDKKADDMAKAIAQQNKKVEEESEALEKEIDEKGKQVDTKEQEDKFEKASEKMDAVGNAADKTFEQKANLVDKIGEDANNAIENQANKVEALNSRADNAEDKASKLVDKIGKKIEKDSEPVKTKPRMSIAYTLQLPREPHANPMTEKASDYDEINVSNKEAENSYPWPARQDLHEDVPDFNEDPDETKSDMSLKPFDESDADVEHDAHAHASSKERFAPRGKLQKMFSMPQAPFRHRQRQHLKRYRPPFEKASLTFVRPTSKSSDLGLLVLPSGGPRQLPDDIKNQMEEDQLLRKAAKHVHASNNDEAVGATDEFSKSAAEKNMERQWMRINAIGSPELLLPWQQTSENMGNIGPQQFSLVSPGEVDLLQTEYPDYPKPKGMGGDFPGLIRSTIGKKTEATSKKSKH